MKAPSVEMPTYTLRVRGHLADRWSEWLEGFAIYHDEDGNTTLTGHVPDHAALHGLLAKIRDLNLELLEVKTLNPPAL
jgi:hypothetical protein